MDPLVLAAGWLLLAALPAALLALRGAPGRWVFLTFLLGPAGLAGFALSRLAPARTP